MGDVVNLNQWRKRKEREAADKEAAANRVKYGETKLEKLRSTAERERGEKEHEGRLLLDHKPDPKETPSAS